MATETKTNWYKIAIVAMVLIYVYYLGCTNGQKSFKKKHSTIDTLISKSVHDTIFVPSIDTAIKPKIEYRDTGSIITEYLDGDPIYIDTSTYPTALVNDYYSKRTYFDSANGVKVWDTVYQNKLVRQRVKNYRIDTTIVKTDIVLQPKPFQVFYGIDLATNYSSSFNLDLKFPKNDDIISFGVGVQKETPIFYKFGFKKLIKLKKRP